MHEDLWLSTETSKRKSHNCGQLSVNNFHNLNLNFHNLIFRTCVNFDDWQVVCADLKKVPKSCWLKITTSKLENLTFFRENYYTSDFLTFKTICQLYLLRKRQFAAQCLRNPHKKVPAKKRPFLTISVKNYTLWWCQKTQVLDTIKNTHKCSKAGSQHTFFLSVSKCKKCFIIHPWSILQTFLIFPIPSKVKTNFFCT